MDEVMERIIACALKAAGPGPILTSAIRMPTERELTETIGVSRGTIRERLSRLEALDADGAEKTMRRHFLVLGNPGRND